MVIRNVVRRLPVRRYWLLGIRVRITRRRRPVSAAVRWRRSVIRFRGPTGLRWFGYSAGVRRTIRGVSVRGPIGLRWFRNGAGVRRTIRRMSGWGFVGLNSLRRGVLWRFIHGWRPIGLQWFRSFADICFVSGIWCNLSGFPRLRLGSLRLAWLVCYGHGGCGRLRDWCDFHGGFPARGWRLDLLHLSTGKRFATIALDCFLPFFKCRWRRRWR